MAPPLTDAGNQSLVY